ncbi:unnamed protein product [Symbiodinium necroappetens]|uniref:Uncharacterized protein n=1 Tax=Symbiodinium necroappetens TaxID=1628268 RepID=A0A813BQE9_9DINO|nr:unnamed protein product [Symbiodinium necroappetens]
MESLVPQKPSTPPPHTSSRRARRHVVTTPVSEHLPQEPGRKRSRPNTSVLVSSQACSMHGTSPSALPDLQGKRVRFQETPEIILFLSDPKEGRAASLPVLRPLAPITEEAETPRREIPYVGGTPVAPGRPRPSPMPGPQDSCEGGLAALSAERRATMFQNLFPESPQC